MIIVLVGCLVRALLVIASMPVMIWILIYRIATGKSNAWLIDWIFD